MLSIVILKNSRCVFFHTCLFVVYKRIYSVATDFVLFGSAASTSVIVLKNYQTSDINQSGCKLDNIAVRFKQGIVMLPVVKSLRKEKSIGKP